MLRDHDQRPFVVVLQRSCQILVTFGERLARIAPRNSAEKIILVANRVGKPKRVVAPIRQQLLIWNPVRRQAHCLSFTGMKAKTELLCDGSVHRAPAILEAYFADRL